MVFSSVTGLQKYQTKSQSDISVTQPVVIWITVLVILPICVLSLGMQSVPLADFVNLVVKMHESNTGHKSTLSLKFPAKNYRINQLQKMGHVASCR